MSQGPIVRQTYFEESPSTFLALVIAWCLFSGPWGTYTQIAFLTTYLTIPLAFGVVFVLVRFLVARYSIGIEDHDLIFFFIILLAGLSAFWSLYPDEWAIQFFWLIANFSLYILAKNVSKNPRLLFFIAFTGLLCIFMSLFLIDEVYNKWGVQLERSAIADHNNNFTAYAICSAICIAAIYISLFKSKFWFKAFFAVCVLAGLYTINLLGTRGAQISIVAMVIALLVPARLGKPAFLGLLAVLVLLSLLIVTGLAEPIIAALDGVSARSDGELAGRIPTWRSASHYVQENPFLGIGLGAFQHVGIMEINPHNFLFSLLLDWGLVGTLLFIAWLASGFAKIRLPALAKYRVVSVVLAYAVPIALSGEWIFLPQTWIVLGVMFGVAATGPLSAALTLPAQRPAHLPSKPDLVRRKTVPRKITPKAL